MIDKKMDDNLSKMLNLPEPKVEAEVPPTEAITKPEEPKAIDLSTLELSGTQYKGDYIKVRESMRRNLDDGNKAIQILLDIGASGLPDPKVFTAMADMMRTVTNVGKELLGVHDTTNRLLADSEPSKVENNTTNNVIFTGTALELQNLLNPKRASTKAVQDHVRIDLLPEDIIDVTPEES